MYSNIEIPRSPYASEEHQMLKKALDTFFQQEAIPYYEQWEKEQRVPRAFWRKMGNKVSFVWMCQKFMVERD